MAGRPPSGRRLRMANASRPSCSASAALAAGRSTSASAANSDACRSSGKSFADRRHRRRVARRPGAGSLAVIAASGPRGSGSHAATAAGGAAQRCPGPASLRPAPRAGPTARSGPTGPWPCPTGRRRSRGRRGSPARRWQPPDRTRRRGAGRPPGRRARRPSPGSRFEPGRGGDSGRVGRSSGVTVVLGGGHGRPAGDEREREPSRHARHPIQKSCHRCRARSLSHPPPRRRHRHGYCQ